MKKFLVMGLVALAGCGENAKPSNTSATATQATTGEQTGTMYTLSVPNMT